MMYHTSDHLDKFQTFLSAYVIDGFFQSLLEVSQITGWSRYETSPVKPTTTKLNVLLPGIMKYYGAGLPVDVFF
jgi:hypothetical protein